MRAFICILFVILLSFVQPSFAAVTTGAAVVNIQVSLLAILTAALWFFLGVGVQAILLFVAWRLIRIHREIFVLPGGSTGSSRVATLASSPAKASVPAQVSEPLSDDDIPDHIKWGY